MSKPNRIPPKGTQGYRNCFADKHTLADMRALWETVNSRVNDQTPLSKRASHFADAVNLLTQAISAFEAGWKEPYA